MLWHSSQWFLYPSSCWNLRNARGFFSDNHCEKLVELRERKLTKVWGTPCDSTSPSFWLSEPPAICELRLVSPAPALGPGPHEVSRFSGFTCLSSLRGSGLFALRPHFSYRPKKICWFFSLFSLLLVTSMEWWLPHAPYVSDQKLDVHKLFLSAPFKISIKNKNAFRNS